MARQPDPKSKNLDIGVDASPPKLHRLEFVHEEEPIPEGTQATIEYQLSVHRFSHLSIGVEFGASVQNVPGVAARAAFRMVFAIRPDSTDADDPERAFRSLAGRIAPVAMYPFIREALASAAVRAQLPELFLPIANVGALYDPDSIEIPAAEEPSDGAGEHNL
jgi:hypothetical protein